MSAPGITPPTYSALLQDLASACLAYHDAISACADDPDALDTYRSPAGETLDALYMRWLTLAREVVT